MILASKRADLATSDEWIPGGTRLSIIADDSANRSQMRSIRIRVDDGEFKGKEFYVARHFLSPSSHRTP